MSPAQTTSVTQDVAEVDTSIPSNPRLYQHAITKGQEILAQEGSKAAAAREIFTMLHNEHRDVVLKAFIEGASVTIKGAPTYFYNISHKARRIAKADAVHCGSDSVSSIVHGFNDLLIGRKPNLWTFVKITGYKIYKRIGRAGHVHCFYLWGWN